MARQSRAAELGLIALTIEGGLIAPEQIQKVIGADRTARTAESYACPKGTSLGDEIARYFRIGQAIWRDYDKADDKTITRSAAFARDLLSQCLGFTDLIGPVEHQDGARRYRLALEAKGGRVPAVVAAPAPGADAFAKSQPEFGDGDSGRPKRSPVVLLQDWLNATDHAQWGLVFAGDRLRLMRDNASLTRPAWIEADLGAMFRDEMFADFTALWLLCHATRFGAEGAAVSDCALEQWRDAGLKQGVEARKDLYANVATALEELGQGLVSSNPELHERLQSGALSMQMLFEELLRTVYRLIFLAVAEDRDLLHARRATLAARQLYTDGYSFTFWRERSRRRAARDGHHDAWEAMKVTLAKLEHGEEMLGLPALGGLFSSASTPNLNTTIIPNRAFLATMFCLGFIRKDGVTYRINWRDLKTEELGSVYEGLLEIRPSLSAAGQFLLGSGVRGNDRKTSGSYYTPDSLVECLLGSALDPVLERTESGGTTADEKIKAILDLKVIDPACGSGHFLLGAARRMADRVARLRNEDASKEETQAALRDVVSRCIHGVDRNPMAVELAKVALWIESVSPGQPLGFLDANLRCGDALLGVFDLTAVEAGIPDEAYKPLTGDNKVAARYYLTLNRDAKRGQGQLDFAGGGGAMPPRRMAARLGAIKSMPEDTVGQVEKKRAAFDAWKADPARWNTQVACDLYMAAFLLPKTEVPDARGRGMVPTTAEVRRKLAGGSVYGPLEAIGLDAARFANVLHWPLEFPDVVVANGGFDVVLGNPPWERIKLQEQEFFAGHPVADEPNAAARTQAIARLAAADSGTLDRELYDRFQIAKRVAEATSAFARVPANSGGRFRFTGTGDVNTYALFAEHFLNLTRISGRAGLIVPTGIATDATTAPFFSNLVSSQRLAGLTDFENSAPLFAGVHRSFKFCLLTIGSDIGEANFAFFLTDPAQLEQAERRFSLSPAQIARINPNTKTAPVFRTLTDAALTAAIYDRVPVLIDEANGKAGNPWGAYYLRLVHYGDHAEELYAEIDIDVEVYKREGLIWRSDAGDLLPVYESKYINLLDHRHMRATGLESVEPVDKDLGTDEEINPRYWVSSQFFEALINKYNYEPGWLLAYRDIARSNDIRTLIATAIPRFPASVNLPTLGFSVGLQGHLLLANFTALTLDFVARQKLSGAHMTFGTLKQLPIIPPSGYCQDDRGFIVPLVLELSYTSHSMAPFARDLGFEGPPFAWDEDRRASLRAQLDAWYALAYGLTRDDLRYMLDPRDVMGPDYPSETFRVLQNNEMKKYGEYRTSRLVLAAYDRLTKQGMQPRVEGYR